MNSPVFTGGGHLRPDVKDWRRFTVRLKAPDKPGEHVWHQEWALTGEEAIRALAAREGQPASFFISPSSTVEFMEESGSAWDLARQFGRQVALAIAEDIRLEGFPSLARKVLLELYGAQEGERLFASLFGLGALDTFDRVTAQHAREDRLEADAEREGRR